MATVLGIWIALSGVLPALAGLTGLRRVRRLHRDGVRAWAAAVPRPRPDGDHEQVLAYTLPDGRLLEKPMARRAPVLLPGERVLIRYDPEDPLDVLVQGREGHVADLVMAIAGSVLVAVGVVIGVAAP